MCVYLQPIISPVTNSWPFWHYVAPCDAPTPAAQSSTAADAGEELHCLPRQNRGRRARRAQTAGNILCAHLSQVPHSRGAAVHGGSGSNHALLDGPWTEPDAGAPSRRSACQTGTMESKVRAVSELLQKGGDAILRSPNILGMSFEKYEETVDWFISKGVPRDKIPYVFTVFPQGVSYKEETLDQKVDVLKEIGCDDAQIARILTMSPQMLSYGTESLQETVNLLTQLGVPAEKVPSILARVPQCLGLSLDRILETIDALDSMFGPGAGVRALTWNPIIVMHNISGLRRSFNYLVSIGFTKERLQRNTRLLTRSASRILRPRGQFLRSNGEDVVASIGWITMSERAFMEEYPDFKAYLTEHKRRPTKKTPSV
ncbi:hypothetical protein ON010_g13225 [Phytophthora cinnamomi]|nr:hypothetical protein ON010_g13225 [Phytophthora cinnamomi]